MSALPVLELLDASDPLARADYERAFYAAFSRVTGNQLIRSLWQWTPAEQRLATRIPYGQQLVYIARDAAGSVTMSITVNAALVEYQSSAFGFAPPADARGSCEFLTFFAVRDHRLRSKLQFWEACFKDLQARGYHTGYASSAARLVPLYRRIGGEILDETEVQGELRYHWRFSLARYWMLARQQAQPAD